MRDLLSCNEGHEWLEAAVGGNADLLAAVFAHPLTFRLADEDGSSFLLRCTDKLSELDSLDSASAPMLTALAQAACVDTRRGSAPRPPSFALAVHPSVMAVFLAHPTALSHTSRNGTTLAEFVIRHCDQEVTGYQSILIADNSRRQGGGSIDLASLISDALFVRDLWECAAKGDLSGLPRTTAVVVKVLDYAATEDPNAQIDILLEMMIALLLRRQQQGLPLPVELIRRLMLFNNKSVRLGAAKLVGFQSMQSPKKLPRVQQRAARALRPKS